MCKFVKFCWNKIVYLYSSLAKSFLCIWTLLSVLGYIFAIIFPYLPVNIDLAIISFLFLSSQPGVNAYPKDAEEARSWRSNIWKTLSHAKRPHKQSARQVAAQVVRFCKHLILAPSTDPLMEPSEEKSSFLSCSDRQALILLAYLARGNTVLQCTLKSVPISKFSKRKRGEIWMLR